MAVGANSVRPPLFAYMVCTNSTPATPRNGTSCFCKAEIALLPYRYSGKFLPPQNRSALCGLYVVQEDSKAVQSSPLRLNLYIKIKLEILLSPLCTAW